jgi:soluble lytic murein transglycosylase
MRIFQSGGTKLMKSALLDTRLAGAALATACCLLIPTQEKPLRWLAQQTHRLAPPAPMAAANGTAKEGERDESAAVASGPQPAAEQTAAQAEVRRATQAELEAQAEIQAEAAAMGYDLSGVNEALTFYREGHHEQGDAALATRDPIVRAAVEWSFLRAHAVAAGVERIAAFMRAHPDFPVDSLRKHAEDLASSESARAERAVAYFAEFPPITTGGEIALADLLRADPARKSEAERMAREVWREGDLSPAQEKRLLKNFGSALTPADHIHRADRLMLREQTAAAGRAAALGGKDAQALFRAQADLANDVAWAKVAPRVPASLRDDPALLYLRIHAERHADHIAEAARLMASAPRDRAVLASPDDWWTERRLIARKLLDQGDFAGAYRICAEHSAASNESRLEAEFHAGWIALRFLNDAGLAAPHFETMALLAHTPHSVSRAAYWRGRVAEAQGRDARPVFARAAAESETFYGQLARAKLGDEAVALRAPATASEGAARKTPVRAAELLFILGEKDAARQLALDSARIIDEPEQMAALSRVIEENGDARIALAAGKAALRRGLAIDSLAYPLNGVPEFVALANSASRPLVLAIARQESAFDATARSGAGAFGLMQMIEGTARMAARSAGVVYDEARLKTDAAFNAQLGAFHLGQLLGQYGGSHILTFAAYNAGGGNVRDWIRAYGDPRKASVDPIDWIERIPFTETRNYVQRVAENLHIYRARLGDTAPSLFEADLKQKVAATE